jgi:hypothetical protein
MLAAWAGREGVSQMSENLKCIVLNDTPKYVRQAKLM